MAARDDNAPEVAPHIYPEAYVPSPSLQYRQQQQQQQPGYGPYHTPPPKPEYPAVASPSATFAGVPPSTTGYTPSHVGEGGTAAASVAEKRRAGRRGSTVCGCTLIVFVLSVIIAILAAAVIGLAAGTGIEASRANDANDKLQRLQSSVSAAGLLATTTPTATSSTAPSATPTAAALDNGCAENPAAVNGQSYQSFKLFASNTFTMRCNQDVNGTVLYSLFATDFNTCMDSCSGYTKYAPRFFGLNVNTTCSGVSFIPLWTNKTIALKGNAPGNCYLKRGPLDDTAFINPSAGTPVHGAILSGS